MYQRFYPASQTGWQIVSKSFQPRWQNVQQLSLFNFSLLSFQPSGRISVKQTQQTNQTHCDYIGVLPHDDWTPQTKNAEMQKSRYSLGFLRRKGIQNTWGDGCSSWRTSAQQLKWKSSRKAFGVYSPTNRETNQVFSLLRRTSVLGASAQDLRFPTRSIHFLVQFWSNRQYRGRRRIRPNVTSGVLSHCKPFNSTCSWNLWSDVRVTSAFSFRFLDEIVEHFH